jgi:hypothetical protein
MSTEKSSTINKLLGINMQELKPEEEYFHQEQQHLALLSTVEPSSFEEANKDEHWIKAMDEELDQIEKNDTWELVPRPKNKNVIGTKWVFLKQIE